MTASYLIPTINGNLYSSLECAQDKDVQPGDIILLRDFSQLVPPALWHTTPTPGKWHLRPYSLASGEHGRLLMVNRAGKSEGDKAVPPSVEIDLGLTGWYAIFLGIPALDLRPRFTFPSGVDVCLDGDPYVHVGPERGSRKGRLVGAEDVEWMCFWKCANLSGRRILLRVPFGTYLSQPWGFVRALISSIKLVRLGEQQVQDYRLDGAEPARKNTIIVSDGFSHYWSIGKPGEMIDSRLPEAYQGRDVKMLILQSPSTGVVSWKSKVASMIGEDMNEEEWQLRRLGDRRAYEYIRWAVESGHEGMRVMAEGCRKAGIEFHTSLRMNLFWREDYGFLGKALDRFLNGKWWYEHPEARKKEDVQIDYAHPETRRFILDLIAELASRFDIDGVNLDFTRWPPIADPERHTDSVLTSFIGEVRQVLDGIEKTRRKKLMLSAIVVDGYHARYADDRLMTLADQRIDLEAWLKSGKLSFICVQAWDHTKYRAIANQYNVPYYITQDNDSIRVAGGYRDDPEWRQEARPDEDPAPGEELEEEPHLNSSLDPLEYYEMVLRREQSDQPSGYCLINNAGGWHSLGRLGHTQDLKAALREGAAWGQVPGSPITLADDCA